MQHQYDPTVAEPKWQKAWKDAGVYKTDLMKAQKPYYSLVMFPYPSGDKLHVGHWYNYAPADSYARYMKLKGYDVFSPMGFDAFGLPAENHAIKKGEHPDGFTDKNVKTMISQLSRIGCMYDWDKMVNTSKPEYYKWTQWLFLQMYKNKLAYKKLGNVNFCPSCQTVLANEQAQEGTCERCGTGVIQKPLEQWFWNIKKYSQKLLDGLDSLDWPEKTKTMQRNWIGRSEGAEIWFDIADTRRGILGPINWPSTTTTSGSKSSGSKMSGSKMSGFKMSGFKMSGFKTLAADLNRQLTERLLSRIHSRLRTTHLVFTPYARGAPFDQPTSAALILRIIDATAEKHDIIVHEACAMPDHVHLLVSFDESRNLETDVVKKLKGASAREFLKFSDCDDAHLWGQKKHFVDVLDANQFASVLHYIQNNPAEAHLDPGGRVLSDLPLQVKVFTTRAETLFGATYLVLAPEHPLIDHITVSDQAKVIDQYRSSIAKKTEIERTDLTQMKTGERTGAYAVHPVSGERIPIWIADYALMNYGTGAVMAVPAHDERDYDFAVRRDELRSAIKCVIEPDILSLNFARYVHSNSAVTVGEGKSLDETQKEWDQACKQHILEGKKCWTGSGTMIHSDFLNGLDVDCAKKKMIQWLEKNHKGKGIINYRLRDWLVSRQRYWGAPIPIVYDPKGKPHPVPEEHLPWTLPTDVEFKPTGESPLKHSKEFLARTEKIFGKGWTPEYDTMDTFVCSSFYYLRYLMTSSDNPDTRQKTEDVRRKNASSSMPSKLSSSVLHLTSHPSKELLVDQTLEKKWLPVSMYIGGPEHACMHLIYARFVMMALKDFGFVSHTEPFQRLVHQGLVTNNGAKMSKSKGNVVSPDAFVSEYGSDVFRMYLMFMGPFEAGGDWSDTGIRGIVRFVKRMHAVITEKSSKKVLKDKPEIISALHRTIKRVTADIEILHFNTAIAGLMEFLNLIEKEDSFTVELGRTLAILLAPLAPHLAEELWAELKGKGFVIEQMWPKYDEALTIDAEITVVVQVNGKLRGELKVSKDISKDDVLKLAKSLENVKKYIEPGIKKEIYVSGKLVSFVV